MKNRKQGSALLSAVIVIIIVGLIIGSYISLTVSERKAVERSVLFELAMDIAESAAEDAAHTLNQGKNKYWKHWSDRTVDDQAAKYKEVTDIDMGSGRTGSYKAIILSAGTANPRLIIEGTVHSPLLGDVSRQLSVKLKTRGVFGNGLTAPDAGDGNAKITFTEDDILITGYDSSQGDYSPSFNSSDSVLVAAETKVDYDLNIENAEIFGSVATAGGEIGKRQATVRGKDSQNNFGVDNDRVYDNYYANAPEVKAPSLDNPQESLPSAVDGQIKIGESSENYKVKDLDVGKSEELVIAGPTVVVVTKDADIDGDIVFESGGNLKLYVKDDLNITGDVYMDDVDADDFLIFGTAKDPGGSGDNLSEIYLNHLGELKAGV